MAATSASSYLGPRTHRKGTHPDGVGHPDLGCGHLRWHRTPVAAVAHHRWFATAVPAVRLTNHVLNASFYRPHLLARDTAAVHQLGGGRFVTSLGTGYAEQEFAAAGIPFSTACLRHTVRPTCTAHPDRRQG